jgi:hypothetical protein
LRERWRERKRQRDREREREKRETSANSAKIAGNPPVDL